jgi:colanic acid/amylovoran biosynthesis glycosyltransferase
VNLRLAYLTGQYPRATDTFIQREVEALRALEHHVQTFSVRKPPQTENVGPETKAARESTIYLLPPQGLIKAHLIQLFSSPGKYFSALALAYKYCPPGVRSMARQIAYFAEAAILTRLMKKHSLSHLHNHFADSSCSVAVIAATMGGFTFSFTMHGPAEFFEPRSWWIDEKIRRALFVNCISHFCRSQALIFAPTNSWNKLRIVHCGVDPNLFEVKRHQGRGNRLLFVGRLATAKGLAILLQAVSILDGVTLEIAGDGPERRMLEELARELTISDRTKFLGYQSPGQVRDLLKRADVFVLSSFAEGLPVVLMEAMAAGVPVVATRIAGIPELVQDGHNGLLVPPGDASATAEAIRRLLDDANLRNRFAVAGRDKIQREFDVHAESRWLAAIMTGALGNNCERIDSLRPVEIP